MTVKKRGGWVALIVFAFAAFASLAQASVLAPGGSGSPDSLDASGPILADTGVLSFTGTNGLFSGTVETLVVADSMNKFGAGDLTFLFEVKNNSSSTDTIQRITDGQFGGFLTDVGQGPYHSPFGCSTTSVGASTVDRSSDGNVVGWNYSISAGLAPGDCSEVLIVDTNAQGYTTGHIQVINSDIATVASFAPAVPEPGSLVLFGAGLLGLGTFLRRRLGARA